VYPPVVAVWSTKEPRTLVRRDPRSARRPGLRRSLPCWSSWPWAPRNPTRAGGPVVLNAYVRRLDEDRGLRLGLQPGARPWSRGGLLLPVLHDDCAPDPTRSTCSSRSLPLECSGRPRPRWCAGTNPALLLHVGRNADKTGASSNAWPRASGPRPATTACVTCSWLPAAITLVARGPLSKKLGGFDAGHRAMAEDLDFSLAGPGGRRPVFRGRPPTRRIRHLEPVSGGYSRGASPHRRSRACLAPGLERRHRAARRGSKKLLDGLSLIRVLPQALLLAIGRGDRGPRWT